MSWARFRGQLQEKLAEECSELLRSVGLTNGHEVLASGRLMRSHLAQTLGQDRSGLLDLCLALELLHTSTLVHDDIYDRAETRRGFKTLSSVHGADIALGIGNLLEGRTYAIVATIGSNYNQMFVHTKYQIDQGQVKELVMRSRVEKTREQYLEIVDGKTAAMLRLATQIGIGNISGEDVDMLLRAVTHLAYAFQILDDVEDLEAHAKRSTSSPLRSKAAASDIELGNYTLPIIIACENMHGSDPRMIAPDMISPSDLSRGIKASRNLAREELKTGIDMLKSLMASSTPVAQKARDLEKYMSRLSARLETSTIESALAR